MHMYDVDRTLVSQAVQSVSDQTSTTWVNWNFTGDRSGDAMHDEAIDLVPTCVHSGMAGGRRQDRHIVPRRTLL
jgi:hypothetical protein